MTVASTNKPPICEFIENLQHHFDKDKEIKIKIKKPYLTSLETYIFYSRYCNFRTFTSPRLSQFSCLAIDHSGDIVCAGALDTSQSSIRLKPRFS